jgi:hypothetical protein
MERARFFALYRRLSAVQAAQVLHVVFPSQSMLRRSFVAVGPENGFGGNVGPLVVIATALEEEPAEMSLNPADLQIIQNALHMFGVMLGF